MDKKKRNGQKKNKIFNGNNFLNDLPNGQKKNGTDKKNQIFNGNNFLNDLPNGQKKRNGQKKKTERTKKNQIPNLNLKLENFRWIHTTGFGFGSLWMEITVDFFFRSCMF